MATTTTTHTTTMPSIGRKTQSRPAQARGLGPPRGGGGNPGPPPGGNPPGRNPLGGNPPPNNKLAGQSPTIFNRDCCKSEAFMQEWNIY